MATPPPSLENEHSGIRRDFLRAAALEIFFFLVLIGLFIANRQTHFLDQLVSRF